MTTRPGATHLLALLCFLLFLDAPAFAGTLTVAERVACLTAIEDIRWSHRIWPETNPLPRPERSDVLPDRRIRADVLDALRMEAALTELYGIQITDQMLQSEIDRMARTSRAPERLQELFDALGNDPREIAECLARPRLVTKILRERFAYDPEIHRETRLRAEAGLAGVADPGALEQWLALVPTGNRTSGPDGAPEVSASGRRLQRVEIALSDLHSERRRLTRLAESDDPAVGLRETETSFVFSELIEDKEDLLEVHSLVWPKKDFDTWWRMQSGSWTASPTAGDLSTLHLPRIADLPQPSLGEVTGDTWALPPVPSPREYHVAVWTGSEMIVWGGCDSSCYNTGGRYDPSTNAWVSTSVVAAPSGRGAATAVWTGSEMIVWGGVLADNTTYPADGGRYSPLSDSWTPVTTADAPSPRKNHTAVWTGTEMIVWGGYSQIPPPENYNFVDHNTGGRYDPTADSWTATTTDSVPAARYAHTAIWTGTEMIVWGGTNLNNQPTSTGGRYDPSDNSWAETTTDSAPSGRYTHTAVWTGSEMVVWGGSDGASKEETGGRYDPSDNSWTDTSTTDAPDGRAFGHSAVWTGSEMVVWGGQDATFLCNTGGLYDPSTDTWTDTTETGAPTARWHQTAVWTGSEMIVWGGGDYWAATSTGGRYDPATNTWTGSTSTSSAPGERRLHSAVWTGNEMIVWGGYGDLLYQNTGGVYDPATNAWTDTTVVSAPPGRNEHTAVWTGTDMIVWGGRSAGTYLGSGGVYDPAADEWTPTSPTDPPERRSFHTAVWTGSEMIIWGGANDDGGMTDNFNTGGRYNPAGDDWTATTLTGAPAARRDHTAVWTGSKMVVWGGWDGGTYFNLPELYDPETGWSTGTGVDAPLGRAEATAVWSGSEMIVWGGEEYVNDNFVRRNTGGRYDPAGDQWTPTTTSGAPTARHYHSAVWSGDEMIIWGGSEDYTTPINTGSRYSPATGMWNQTTTAGAPSGRYDHRAVWSGISMLVWGGQGDTDQSTGIYYPDDLYTVGGTLGGLESGSSVVLQNNGSDDLTLNFIGDFTFPTPVKDGGMYDVSVRAQPTTPTQLCTVTSGNGIIASASVGTVLVDCVAAFSIGGTVAGLEADAAVILQNNDDDDLTVTKNGAFTFPTGLLDGTPYDVTVLAHPSDPAQICTVDNGSGTVTSADISDVSVTCETSSTPQDLQIDEPLPVTSDTTYEACSTITVSALTIAAPANVVFRASVEVVFSDGFSVEDGATFMVVLEAPAGCP